MNQHTEQQNEEIEKLQNRVEQLEQTVYNFISVFSKCQFDEITRHEASKILLDIMSRVAINEHNEY